MEGYYTQKHKSPSEELLESTEGIESWSSPFDWGFLNLKRVLKSSPGVLEHKSSEEFSGGSVRLISNTVHCGTLCQCVCAHTQRSLSTLDLVIPIPPCSEFPERSVRCEAARRTQNWE